MIEKLNKKEMLAIKGGVSREEYCKTLRDLFANNQEDWSEEEMESWANAYMQHC